MSQPTVQVCSIDGCVRGGRMTRGLCDTHYARLIRTGSAGCAQIKPNTSGMSPAEKFAHYVDTSGGPDACHPWMGMRHDYGYGLMSIDGKHVYAHRWICGETRGEPLGPDEIAMHSCDNPPCCNSAHISAGTHAENMEDKVAKGRARSRYSDVTHCIRGHELSGDNLKVLASGSRRCQTCHAIRDRKYKEQRKRARLAAAS